MPNNSNTIGGNLRSVLDEKGISSAALARATGLTPVSVSAIVTGKTKAPKYQTLSAIAAFLDVPVERITGGLTRDVCEPVDKPEYYGAKSIPVLSSFELYNTPSYEKNVKAKELIALPVSDRVLNPVAYAAETSCLFPQYCKDDIFVIDRALTVPEVSAYYTGDDRDPPKEGTLIAVKAEVKNKGIIAVGYASFGIGGELLVKVNSPSAKENHYIECREYIGPVVAVYRSLV